MADAGIGEFAILSAILSSSASIGSGAVAAGGAAASAAGTAAGGLSLGTLASGASIGAAGLTAASSIMKGQGQKSADEMQADRLTRAAEFGKVQADLTDATMREQLNTTLGNIDVIRAAGHIDPTSPTTAALEERQRQLGNRQGGAAGLNIRSQVSEDEASADYLRKSGNYALLQGYLGAGASAAGAIGKGFTSRPVG